MKTLKYNFVDNIPEKIEEGVLYISIPFETAIHKCCCGCGNEVVTPISPTDWSFTFDGESISLNPSIGSWSLDCRSHYFIRKNKIVWSNSYNDTEIEEVRNIDRRDKQKHFNIKEKKVNDLVLEDDNKVQEKKSFIMKGIEKLRNLFK